MFSHYLLDDYFLTDFKKGGGCQVFLLFTSLLYVPTNVIRYLRQLQTEFDYSTTIILLDIILDYSTIR